MQSMCKWRLLGATKYGLVLFIAEFIRMKFYAEDPQNKYRTIWPRYKRVFLGMAMHTIDLARKIHSFTGAS